MSAQYPTRTPTPEQVRQEFLEAVRMELTEAALSVQRAARAMTELTELEGFGEDLRPEIRDWARGGIHALIEGRLPRRLDLEVAG